MTDPRHGGQMYREEPCVGDAMRRNYHEDGHADAGAGSDGNGLSMMPAGGRTSHRRWPQYSRQSGNRWNGIGNGSGRHIFLHALPDEGWNRGCLGFRQSVARGAL